MKHLFKRGTALLLSLAMALSLLCVSGFAADLEYAHLEIGTVTVDKLEAGDTVKIPVNLVGLQSGRYCGGFDAVVTLGEGLEWPASGTAGAEWNTTLLSSFGSKSLNKSTNYLTAIDFGASSNQTSSCTTNGWLCNLVCVVSEDYDGTNATVKLTNVNINQNANTFLNSSDLKVDNKDTAAVIFNGTKVGNTAVSPITVSTGGTTDPTPDPITPASYSIVATATPAEVYGGQDVTVKVTVKGGQFVAAAVTLTWDTDKLTLKTAPASGWDTVDGSDSYTYYNVNNNGTLSAEDTVIGTFVFTAKTPTAETTANVTLSRGFVEYNYAAALDGISTAASLTNASVTIKLGELDVTAPQTFRCTYDGAEHSFNAVTCSTEGAKITYSETVDGTYTETIPTKKNAGDYDLYYKVEKDGYTTVTGKTTLKIEKRNVTIVVPAQGKTYGAAEPTLTYTVENLVTGDTFDATVLRVAGEGVGFYNIIVTPGENPNYNVTSNPGGTFTISKGTITGWKVYWKNIIEYNGRENPVAEVTKTSDATDATITWTVNGQDVGSDVPTLKDAGTYVVTYTISKDGYSTITDSKTFNVAKKAITITADDKSADYNEDIPELTGSLVGAISGNADDELYEKVKYTTTATKGSAVGTYAINVDLTDTEGGFDKNYTVTTHPGTLTINPATITGWTVNWSNGWEYWGASSAAATLTKADDATDATIEWELDGVSTGTTIPTMKDADTYTVSYTISKDGYAPLTDSKQITVTKKPVTLKAMDKSKNYGEENPTLQAQVTSGDIYESDLYAGVLDSMTFSTAATKTSDVGTYDITINVSSLSPAFTKNYNVTTDKGTLTINPATMSGWSIVSKGTVQYTGAPQVSATVTTGIPADATVTYTWGNGSSNEIPSFTEVGEYTVGYAITHKNYVTVEDGYTFRIESGSIEATGTDVNVTYDGQPHGITVTVAKPEGTTVSYSTDNETWSTTNPTFTDVTSGAVTVYWKVTKDGYTDKTGSNTVTITPADMGSEVDVQRAESVEYDGQPHPSIKTVTIPTGATIVYSTDGGQTWFGVIPQFTDSATYYVNYKVTKANYADVTGEVTFGIGQKAVTITPNDKSVTLGSTLPTLDGSVTGLVNATDLGTITYTCSTFDNTKTGDYPITVAYTENSNYYVTVKPAKVSVYTPAYQVEYVNEYVAGYHMILVYTDSNATFSFDSKAMYDVTSAGYKYGDTAYSHVYAIVVKGVEGDTEESVTAKIAVNMTPVAATLVCNTLDVNSSNSVDLRDAVAVVAVYNANETYMTSYLPIVLKADVSHDKKVDASDFNLIKAEYLK